MPENSTIDTHIAAKMLGFGMRYIQKLCEDGTFSTAHKPGKGKQARWRIARLEVIEKKHKIPDRYL
jgi:hypothetical protein